MSSLFEAPKGPDKSLIAAQKRQAEEASRRQAELDAEEDARRRALAARSRGRALVLFGDERGVVDTLGGTSR